MNSLSILVSTCSSYKDTWRPLSEGLDRLFNVTGRRFDIYVISTTQADRGNFPATWNPIELNGDRGWSDNLLAALEAVPSDYVLLWLDDIIPVAASNEAFWTSIDEFLQEHRPTYLRLSPKPKSHTVFKRDRHGLEYYSLPKGIPYRNSTILALWNRRELIKALRPGETAWQFEVAGSERSGDKPFYCFNVAPIQTVNLIVKGLIEPRSLRKIRQCGLSYDTHRKKIPLLKLAKLRAKEMLHTVLIRALPTRAFTFLQRVRHRT